MMTMGKRDFISGDAGGVEAVEARILRRRRDVEQQIL
jgi:hypothetical protein